mgnify:CR=1 FL=1
MEKEQSQENWIQDDQIICENFKKVLQSTRFFL